MLFNGKVLSTDGSRTVQRHLSALTKQQSLKPSFNILFERNRRGEKSRGRRRSGRRRSPFFVFFHPSSQDVEEEEEGKNKTRAPKAAAHGRGCKQLLELRDLHRDSPVLRSEARCAASRHQGAANRSNFGWSVLGRADENSLTSIVCRLQLDEISPFVHSKH